MTAAIIILSLIALGALAAMFYVFKSSNNNHILLEEKSKETAAAMTAAKSAQDEVARQRERINSLEESLDAEREKHIRLTEENSRLCERIRFVEEEKQRLAKESELRFKELATSIMNEHSRNFKEQNETRLNEILTPLKENIEQFKKSINESYSKEARERFSLQEKIKELMELNQSIGKEAKELATALRRDSKTQGNWGEMILESILEKSGLEKGREYTVQQTRDESGQTLRNEENRGLRPDVVVNYPDGRHLVIDSKVSLTAYVEYVNCDDPSHREILAKRHVDSVRAHICELDKKSYQDVVGGGQTDFVMMFIPNEGAYSAAMQLSNSLWQEAYDKHVLIVSPTHLISALKLIEQLWRHDKIANNYIEIARLGGTMYDKFVGFVNDMHAIRKSIDNTRDSYDKAMNKLCDGRGNLVSRAEKLKKLGAKTNKSMPLDLSQSDDNTIDDDILISNE